MQLTSMRCPSCGGSVQIPEGKPFFFCTFCGTQIHVDDGTIRVEITQNVNVTNHIIDEARLRELDLQEQARLRIEQQREEVKNEEKTKKKKWLRYCIIWLISLFVFDIILCMTYVIGYAESGDELGSFPLFLFLGGLFLLYFIFPSCIAGIMPNSFFSINTPLKQKRRCKVILACAFIVISFASIHIVARVVTVCTGVNLIKY